MLHQNNQTAEYIATMEKEHCFVITDIWQANDMKYRRS